MEINDDLKKYIEDNIFPIYEKNEKAHGIEHIEFVIDRSLKFAQEVPDVNFDIVYTVAAFHDIGHHIDPKKHEIISAEIMYQDENLKKFFSDEERIIIKEAIEDHRSSSKSEPRSVYGKIVSTADRNNSVDLCLRRSYSYNKKLHPEYNDRQIFEDCYIYFNKKFGEDGYAKSYFKDSLYEQFLKEIRELLSDKELFIETQKNYIDELKVKGEI
jgi:uncharacterized protein